MTAYVIVEMDVTDPAAYEGYKAAAAPSVAAFGGTYVVRGGPAELLEGDRDPARIVVLQFPDPDAARSWYGSAGYTAARALRAGAATGRLILVEGLE
ncbi:MAG TPA: DUF1330 domain-containing protein [Acidimicrobiales bacterium]|nr:DUF1330 domain-containing protein [Acidimicrobiales bacterium]